MRHVPAEFTEAVRGRPAEPDISGDDWLAGLPHLINQLLDEWELTVDGTAMHGQCAVVLAVRQGSIETVLKVTWPHAEAAHEHLALRAWDGDGAVRLLRADPRRWAMLLERLIPIDLTTESVLEGCEVIGSLMQRLDRPALPRLHRLSDTAAEWESLCSAGSNTVPRRFTDQARSLIHDLRHGEMDRSLVHQDLHFANVLRAEREPWLAIDPKPVAGEWEFAVAPVIWNREDLTASAHNARAHLRLRLALVCDAAELDEERAAAWTFVRVIVNALWGADDPAWVTRMITIAKAMTD